MTDQTVAEMVEEFHRTFGAYIADKPALAPVAVKRSRVALLAEECGEAIEAMETAAITHDPSWLPSIARELADVVYIAYGAALNYGIPLDAVIAEVHRANMRKLDANGRPIVNAAGKVLKPEGWQPPNIAAAMEDRGCPAVTGGFAAGFHRTVTPEQIQAIADRELQSVPTTNPGRVMRAQAIAKRLGLSVDGAE
jgi:predicted HAD superfamily Cof-like phosphohydrolase